MTTLEIGPPAPLSELDRNGVRRSKDGRPYVKKRCREVKWEDGGPCVDGRVPGARAGTTKKCPTCKGTGFVETLYTRCTTFVGALEDRQNLERWMKRTVLLGIAADHTANGAARLLHALAECDPDDRTALDQLADEAFEAGDGYVKSRKGTDLHLLAERVDQGEPLGDVSLEDRLDMGAYKRCLDVYGIEVLDMEVFVVQDDYRIGGTYDRRVVSYDDRLLCATCEDVWSHDKRKPKVLDLKTGRVDYGGGKMRQQLAVYANSDNYDPDTGERSPQDVCPHVGFILHLAQGQGVAELYRVDLVAGWSDVALSAAVREHRRTSRDALERIGDSP